MANATLPAAWRWLSAEPAPRILTEALALHGVRETAGPANTPAIMNWAREVGPKVAKVYSADSIPWCGLFMAVVARRAAKSIPESPLWARVWATWGDPSPQAALGDVLVFVRKGGGHVGVYVGEDATSYAVLGGNQGDAVSIVWIAKSRCIAVRREYRIGPPANVRKVMLKRSGALSRNEA
jgi:uncharacterized protein (TIGR02594 family)